jgi:AcrR family transcriptional regulator
VKREQNVRGSGEQLRDQLVSAASELLLAPTGIAAPSLRAVARAVGVSPAAVYLHFESVQALILAVIEAQYDDLRAHLADVAMTDDSLAATGVGYANWGLSHAGAYQLLFESADELELDVYSDLAGGPGWDLIESIATRLERETSIPREQAVVLAIRVWTSLHGVVSLRIHKAGHTWPTTIEQEVHALLGLIPSYLPRANTPESPGSLH